MTDENQPASKPILTEAEAHQLKITAAHRAHDDATAFWDTANNAAIKAGEEVIKALILVNGGSSVAMLAFIGTLVSQRVVLTEQVPTITAPLIYFAAGVACAISANAVAYFVNLAIAHSISRKERHYDFPFVRATQSTRRAVVVAEVLRGLAVLLAACSIGLFISGVISAKTAFGEFKPAMRAMPTSSIEDGRI